MAIDFPSSPSEGQRHFVGTVVYTFTGGVWKAGKLGTAEPFNYVVNPAMYVSQQNGSTASGAHGYWVADQWQLNENMATAVVSAWRFPGVTPNGSPYRLNVNVTTIQASLAAGEFFAFAQPIEGFRIADLAWGSAGAKAVVLRFGFVGKAGTYTAALRNAAMTHMYPCMFTITPVMADTFTEWVFAVPGPTVGTWPTDTSRSLEIWITLACGTSLIAPAALAWNAHNGIAGPGQTNGMAALNTFQLYDVGLYADPRQTGKPPLWESPSEREAMRDCQRYWYKIMHARGVVGSATAASRMGTRHPVPMRTGPAYSLLGGVVYDIAVAPAVSSLGGAYNSPDLFETEMAATAGGLTPGRGVIYTSTSASAYIAASARM